MDFALLDFEKMGRTDAQRVKTVIFGRPSGSN